MNTKRLTKDELKGIVERIENLENGKKAVSEDIAFVYSQAKNQGFDIKIIRKIIRARKANLQEVVEQQVLFETYAKALDMDLELNVDQLDMGF